jgi:hypothetical protein
MSGNPMSEKSVAAESNQARGYGFAQTVLAPFVEEFGIRDEAALRISTGFGSGMGRLCEVCGVLTGGFIVMDSNMAKETQLAQNTE